MSDALQSWLDQVPAFAGLLGAFVTVSRQREQCQIRLWSDAYRHEGIQSLQRHVQDVIEVLDAEQMPARKLRWIFEQTVVYFERRKDGAGMCLITTHEPWVGESEVISNLIAQFRSAL